MSELEVRAVVKTLPEINFHEYEKLKSEAIMISEYLSQMEVTEDNIKEQKKILARVNKSVKLLNDRRIAIKKEILEPYTVFESQVKEIEKIVKDADEVLRNQVREIEEREREEKKKKLKDIWDLRITQYKYAKIFEFDDWITSQHLNKTYSMNKCEDDMVNFLETTEKDLEVLSSMEDAADLRIEYKSSLSVSDAINAVNSRKRIVEEQKEIIQEDNQKYYLSFDNKKDFEFAKMVLKEKEINFKEM